MKLEIESNSYNQLYKTAKILFLLKIAYCNLFWVIRKSRVVTHIAQHKIVFPIHNYAYFGTILQRQTFYHHVGNLHYTLPAFICLNMLKGHWTPKVQYFLLRCILTQYLELLRLYYFMVKQLFSFEIISTNVRFSASI